MRLTPLDIRKQEFSRGFRGYDAEEVNAFLQMVANQWEELQDENRRRQERIRELEGKLVHYEKVEEALQEALQTARESSRKALQNAEERAGIIVDQAEARAEEIKREAERERHDLKRETVKLSSRRSEIVSRLRAFLMSEMEMLARYEGDDPVGFIKLLPAEENRLRRLSERLEEKEDAAGREMPSGRDDAPVTDAEERALKLPQDYGVPEKEGEHGPDTPESGKDAPRTPLAEPSGEQPLQERGSDEQVPPRYGEPPRHGAAADAPARQNVPDERRPIEAGPASETYWAPEATKDDSEEEAAVPPEHQSTSSQPPDRNEVIEGPGWTARTVVSPSDQQEGRAEKQRSDVYESGPDDEDETDTRTSSEEIEKIRRILSDLD